MRLFVDVVGLVCCRRCCRVLMVFVGVACLRLLRLLFFVVVCFCFFVVVLLLFVDVDRRVCFSGVMNTSIRTWFDLLLGCVGWSWCLLLLDFYSQFVCVC